MEEVNGLIFSDNNTYNFYNNISDDSEKKLVIERISNFPKCVNFETPEPFEAPEPFKRLENILKTSGVSNILFLTFKDINFHNLKLNNYFRKIIFFGCMGDVNIDLEDVYYYCRPKLRFPDCKMKFVVNVLKNITNSSCANFDIKFYEIPFHDFLYFFENHGKLNIRTKCKFTKISCSSIEYCDGYYQLRNINYYRNFLNQKPGTSYFTKYIELVDKCWDGEKLVWIDTVLDKINLKLKNV